MNNNSNYDRLVQSMKNIQLKEINVAPQVMERIHAYKQTNEKPIRTSFRIRAWVVAVTLFLVTTVSVSAAVTSLFYWNGDEIATFKYEANVNTSWRANMTEIEIIDHELQNRPTEWKAISLEEAQKASPVSILRPSNTDKTPSRTFGVTALPDKKPATKDDVFIGGFYDFFEQGKQQILVRQMFDKRKSDEGKTRYHFPEQWEVVKVDDRIMSIFSNEENFSSLELWIRSDDVTTIFLTLSGNVTKKQLVQLAEAYIGKKLKL